MPKANSKFCVSWLDKEDGLMKVGEWCSKSKLSEFHAYCKVCKSDFKIGNQGIAQVLQHRKGKKHIDRISELENQKRINISENVINNTKEVSLNVVCRKQLATQAEILWALKVVSQNWSFASSDGIVPLFSTMFPNCLPDGFTIGSSKLSYLITDAIGPFFKKKLLKDLKESPSHLFTLHYDETTNTQNNKELMINIRYWSNNHDEVKVRHLQTFFMGHATGEDLANNLIECINSNNLQLNHLLSLGSDGPNVNKKVWSIINKMVLEDRPHKPGLLDIGSCSLHTVHNALRKGLEVFGKDVSDLAISIFYWFSQSSAREEDYLGVQKSIGVPLHKFLRHVETRWLTLKPAAERILEQIKPLKEYFLKFLAKPAKKLNENKKYLSICKLLKKPSIEAEICHVINACEVFSRALLIFQKEEPVIHILYEELRDLVLVILTRIVKTTALDKHKHNIHKINLDDESIFLEKPNVGSEVSRHCKILSESGNKLFLLSIKKFYVKIAKYLIVSTVSKPLLKNLRFLKPSERNNSRSFDDLKKVADVLPLEKDVSFDSKLSEEWKLLQLEDFQFDDCQRVDNYWRAIGQLKTSLNIQKYGQVMKVVRAALCIPHGNADVERGFSESSRCLTSDRTNMSLATINACLTIKDGIRPYKTDLHLFPISRELMESARVAHSRYKMRLEIEKEEKEKERKAIELEKQEKERVEMLQREKYIKDKTRKDEINSLATKVQKLKDEKDILSQVGDQLLTEANLKLKKAIKNKDFAAMTAAQAMIEACEGQRAKEKATAVTLKSQEGKLLKRQSSVIETFFSKKPKI